MEDLWIIKCVLFCLCLSFPTSSESITSCTRTEACKCTTNDGQIIDISPLNSETPPQYSAVGPDNYEYQWQPCIPFGCGTFMNAAVCQVFDYTRSKTYKDGGDQSTEKFGVDKTKGIYVHYSADTDIARETSVYLKCDSTYDKALFKVTGTSVRTPSKFEFEVTSKYACPKGGRGRESNIGTYLLIVFFGALLLYFGIGVAANVFCLKKSGIEVVPNHTFWVALPGLVKDGFVFVFGCCSKRPSYDEI